MSVVRRRKDAVDALEHAMQGVQTYDPHRIESRDWDPGLIGKRSAAHVEILDDTPVEHEVTIVTGKVPRRERMR
ncbi:MAG TPA: hypothetical protein VNR90_09680 [Vicinamibacterales bacterium]|nr:hypothetical protein [Vicinamibacterales bacterium]